MRMKDDHMKNSQLKAAYNIQVGTENQFILGYSIHQKTTDTSFLIPHLNKMKEKLNGKMPENIIADAGYGSEENYSFLEKENLGQYVKFNYFHMEQKKKFKENIYRVENLRYDSKNDVYQCPKGRKMQYKETKKYITDNGYETSRRIYQCENCNDCELRKNCHKSKNNRKIKVSPKLNKYKDRVRKNLLSEEGEKLRKKRPIEVESVFGQIKYNMKFSRFSLRGIKNVELEFGLISIAHNLKKIHKLTG